MGDDLGVDVDAHEDSIGVEGEWEDKVNVRRPLGESRAHTPSVWAKDSFVEETQGPSSWAQLEHQRLNHNHQLGSNFDMNSSLFQHMHHLVSYMSLEHISVL